MALYGPQSAIQALTNGGAFAMPSTSTINPEQAGAVMDEVQRNQTALEQVIRQAQAQIAYAAKVMGHHDLFKQDTMPSTGADLFMNMGLDALAGQGTMVTIQAIAAGSGMISDTREDNYRENALGDVQDLLTASSYRPTEANLMEIAQMLPSGGTMTMPQSGMLNWGEFFAAGHDIDTIMAMDPKNPPAYLMEEANLVGLATVAVENAEMRRFLDERDYDLNAAGTLDMVTGSLGGIEGTLTVEMQAGFENTETAIPSLNAEPNQDFKQGLKKDDLVLNNSGVGA